MDQKPQRQFPRSPGNHSAAPRLDTKASTNRVINNSSPSCSSASVTFVVNGTHFYVNRDSVVTQKDTMLAKLVSSSPTTDIVRQNDRGEYVVNCDFSADYFRHALEYYKVGYITCPPEMSLADLRELCDFLLIPFNASTIKSYDLRALLHEIANDGARKTFESHLENLIMPSIVQRALKGERECNVVILLDDDLVRWDPKMPPPSGEEQSQILFSTPLHTFFKYLENRDVAKSVLAERGFKKICLGIEGFPMYVDRVRSRYDGKKEASYSYVQRPFIRLSWEKEDARSRHVDFQCIRSRSRSAGSLAAAALEHPVDDALAIVNIAVEPEHEVEVQHDPEVHDDPGASSGEEEDHP